MTRAEIKKYWGIGALAFCFALAYGNGKQGALIYAWNVIAGNTMELDVRSSSAPGSMRIIQTTDLTSSNWQPAAHADAIGHPFVLTNLTYSTILSNNHYAVYVQLDENSKYFRVETQ